MPSKDKKTTDKDRDRKIPKINHSNELHSKFLKRIAIYTLFTILTIVLTVLVFYRAKGYTFTKNGQVERRGIVLVNSAPVAAKIFLDGKSVDKTDAKLEVPEGRHTVRLEADGYRTWQRNFNMEREKVVWLYYPYLIPKTLSAQPFLTNEIPKTYSGVSSEGRIIASSLVGLGSDQTQVLDLINLREADPTKASTNLTVSNLLFTRQADGSYGQIKFIEWSPNGDSILLEHTYDGKKEVVNLRINNPSESTNLTQQLSADLKEVHYDSRSRLYALVGSELGLYDPKSLTKNQVITSSATSFQNFDDDKYVYSTQTDAGSDIYVQDAQSKPVRVTALATKDISQFDYKYIIDRRVAYLAITNSASKELQIFKNPLDLSGIIAKTGTEPAKLTPLYLATFEEMKSPKIEDSPGGSTQPGTYIALQLSGKKIFIYDFEEETAFSYDLKLPEDPNKDINIADISWLDPQRLQARSAEGDIYYFDYDGNYVNLIGNTTQESSYFVRSRASTFLVSNNSGGGNQLNVIKFKN